MLNQTSIIGNNSSSSNNDARTRLLEKRNGEKRTLENDDDDDEHENDSLFHNKCLKNVLIVNENENSHKKREIKRVLNENDVTFISKSMITCKICLNKFYDVIIIEGEANNNNRNNNRIYQLELCKCKFCLNVSVFF